MLRRRQLQAAVGAAIVAIGLGASALGASASSQVTQANATASPSFNLTNGEKIWVSGSGFPKSTTNNQVSIAIVECNSKVATQGSNACDIAHVVITHSTVTGRVAARAYIVRTGTIGSGTGAGRCDHLHSCFMVVATLDQSTAGLASIHFA
jgi:hypothetical protein